MADVLRDGAVWLAGKLKAFASRTVLYRRGAVEVSVQATVGRTLLRLTDGYGGVRMERTDRDFLIAAADLAAAFGPSFGEPEPGDRVTETGEDGAVHTFEALPYGGTEPCWRWADDYRVLYRIHCKQVGVA